MCSKKIFVLNTCTSLEQWEELYITNFLQLPKIPINHIYGELLKCDEMKDLGVALYNLGRRPAALRQLLGVYMYTKIENKIPVLIGIADLLLSDQLEGCASVLYEQALYMMRFLKEVDSDQMQNCVKQKQVCEENLKLWNNNSCSQGLDYLTGGQGQTGLLFLNYRMFEMKIRMMKFLLKNVIPEDSADREFSKDLVKLWDKYKFASVSFLSGMVTNGERDCSKSIESVYNFISTFPNSKLLVTKILDYNSIDRMIEEKLSSYPDFPIEKTNLTYAFFIEQSVPFHKTHNYFEFLKDYFKCHLIQNIKHLLVDFTIPKLTIIHQFCKVTLCCNIIYQLLMQHKISSDKRLNEKRRKLLDGYRDQTKDLASFVIHCGTVSLVYIFLALKLDKSSTKHFALENEVNYKFNEFENSVALLRLFHAYSKSENVELGENKVILDMFAFSNETLAFSCSSTIVSDNYEGKILSFKNCNKFFTERLISCYVKLLVEAKLDDYNNIQLIECLMYAILLQGGYSVSTIWILNQFKEFVDVFSLQSLVSHYDGNDDLLSLFCGHNILKHKKELDLVIKKICNAMDIMSNSYTGDKNLFPISNQEYFNDGHKVILPQVLIDNNDELLFLPEFCNFIKDGDTLRINLVKQNINDWSTPANSSGNINRPGQESKQVDHAIVTSTYRKLRSILKPTKNSVLECLKKSELFNEYLINNGKNKLMNKMKQTKKGLKILKELCGDTISIYLPASEADKLDNFEESLTVFQEDKTHVMEMHILTERVHQFKQMCPKEAETASEKEELWEGLIERGLSHYITNMTK